MQSETNRRISSLFKGLCSCVTLTPPTLALVLDRLQPIVVVLNAVPPLDSFDKIGSKLRGYQLPSNRDGNQNERSLGTTWEESGNHDRQTTPNRYEEHPFAVAA